MSGLRLWTAACRGARHAVALVARALGHYDHSHKHVPVMVMRVAREPPHSHVTESASRKKPGIQVATVLNVADPIAVL